jgi:hypothetical protein
MRGAIPPLPHTFAWCGAYLSTREDFILLYRNLTLLSCQIWSRHVDVSVFGGKDYAVYLIS